jgi:AbrB family looped-hinge helix DNA binding protein
MSTDLDPAIRARSRLTRQGQITVPKAVRDALGARAGDDIEFVRQGDAFLVEVKPRRSVLDFAGIAADSAPRVPAAAEDLDELIERGMADAAVARAMPAGSRTSRGT